MRIKVDNSKIRYIKTLVFALSCLIFQFLFVKSPCLAMGRVVDSECRWSKFNSNGIDCNICSFVSASNDRDLTNIFFTPLLLILENPHGFGPHIDVRKYLEVGEKKAIVVFKFVMEEPRVIGDIVRQLGVSGRYQMLQIPYIKAYFSINVPGTSRWIQSKHADEKSVEMGAEVLSVPFEMLQSDLDEVLNAAYYGNLKFAISIVYWSKKKHTREASSTIQYVFPDGLLDTIFSENEYAYLSQQQVDSLYAVAMPRIKTEVLVDDEIGVEYLDEFVKWSKSLLRVAIERQHNISAWNRGNEEKSLGYLSEEKSSSNNDKLIKVYKEDLIRLERKFIDLSSRKVGISRFDFFRNSDKDRIQLAHYLQGENASFESPDRTSFKQIKSVLGIANLYSGALEIQVTSSNTVVLRRLVGPEKIYRIQHVGNFVGYDELAENGCVKLFFTAKNDNIFCVSKEYLSLEYQRLIIKEGKLKGLVVTARPRGIKIQFSDKRRCDVIQYPMFGIDKIKKISIAPHNNNYLIVDSADGSRKMIKLRRPRCKK